MNNKIDLLLFVRGVSLTGALLHAILSHVIWDHPFKHKIYSVILKNAMFSFSTIPHSEMWNAISWDRLSHQKCLGALYCWSFAHLLFWLKLLKQLVHCIQCKLTCCCIYIPIYTLFCYQHAAQSVKIYQIYWFYFPANYYLMLGSEPFLTFGTGILLSCN